jgi:hypothetical protein
MPEIMHGGRGAPEVFPHQYSTPMYTLHLLDVDVYLVDIVE